MKLLLLTLFTIVILDPYQGLDYDEPNLYFIDEEIQKLEIVETLGDGYSQKSDTPIQIPYFLRRVRELYRTYD